MDLRTWNQMQIEIALGEVNRYFFNLHHGRDAKSDEELMEYYAQFGAEVFATLHQGELQCKKQADTIAR